MVDMSHVRMIAEEFLSLPETLERIELINGEVVMSPSPVDPHQDAVLATASLLKHIAPAGKVKIAPLDVYIDGINVVQPDVFWISDTNTKFILVDNKYWHGAPDLVVEVLSPSTAERDYGVKFDLYQQYGVREYWIIDTAALFVQIFRLEKGKFVRQGVFGTDKSFVSSTLGDIVIQVSEIL